MKYTPTAGDYCEHVDDDDQAEHYGRLFYIGLSSTGSMVMNDDEGILLKFMAEADFKPAKSDRELFIEQSLEVTATKCLKDREFYTSVFGAQFDKGARFND
tara:strand:- start:10764 stop:11066 length:303 start_codon:yes stop_codon:yes gene_type:complete